MFCLPNQWLLLMALAASCAAGFGADTSPTLFQGRSTESMIVTVDPESGSALTNHTAVNYHSLAYMNSRKHGLIARETIQKKYLESSEGDYSTATVDLYYGHADKTYSPRPDHTTTVTDASKIHFNNEHWTATSRGCCDTESFLQMFAYGKSTPFFYANSRYAQVNVPNAQVDRYLSVVMRAHTPADPIESAIFGTNKKAVAAILYGGRGMPLSKLLIQPKEGASELEIPYHTDSLTLKSASPKDDDGYNEDPKVSQVLTLWSQDTIAPTPPPATLSGFSIIATFAGNDGKPERIEVPIEKDHFGKAILSGPTLMIAD